MKTLQVISTPRGDGKEFSVTMLRYNEDGNEKEMFEFNKGENRMTFKLARKLVEAVQTGYTVEFVEQTK